MCLSATLERIQVLFGLVILVEPRNTGFPIPTDSMLHSPNYFCSWLFNLHAGVTGNVLITKAARRLESYNVWDSAMGQDYYQKSMLVDLTQPPGKVGDFDIFLCFVFRALPCKRSRGKSRARVEFHLCKIPHHALPTHSTAMNRSGFYLVEDKAARERTSHRPGMPRLRRVMSLAHPDGPLS